MKKIGFIGFGNMAGAIAQGIIQSGFLKPYDCIGYDIDIKMIQKMNMMGIETARDIAQGTVEGKSTDFHCFRL